MTNDEMKALLELDTCLLKIVADNTDETVVDSSLAKLIAEKARILERCQDLAEEIREKYGAVADRYSQRAGL